MFSGLGGQQEYTPLAQEEEDDDNNIINDNGNNSLLANDFNDNDDSGGAQSNNVNSSLSLNNKNRQGTYDDDAADGGIGSSFFGSGFPFGFNAICMCITVTVACAILLGISAFVIIMFRMKQAVAAMKDDRPIVVLVGVDGFRHDFLNLFQAETKNLNKVVTNGVAAESLIPVFPSTTLPNMYSIITGNYPAKHGVVGREVFDSANDAVFSLSDPNLFLSVPLWNIIKQKNIPTASVHWFGSNVNINGSLPTYYEKEYNGQVSSEERVRKVLSYLDMTKKSRPRFISLYLNEVDHAAHFNGVNSAETRAAVKRVDEAIGSLVNGIQKRSRNIPNVQLIIASDHGMIDIVDSGDQQELKVILGDSRVLSYNSTVVNVFTEDTPDIDTINSMFADRITAYSNDDAELKEDLHYSDSDRIGDMILIAQPGVLIHGSASNPNIKASHGYNPEDCPEMEGIFLAQGSKFKKAGRYTKTFQNIHIYPLICKLLNVDCPTDIDGKLSEVSHLLVESK